MPNTFLAITDWYDKHLKPNYAKQGTLKLYEFLALGKDRLVFRV